MNQFKRAKEKSTKSGKIIEKASDLTTAGTSENKEIKENEVSVVSNVKADETLEINEAISPEKDEINNEPVLIQSDTSDTNNSNPKDVISSHSLENVQDTIPNSVADKATSTLELQTQPESPSGNVPVEPEVRNNNNVVEQELSSIDQNNNQLDYSKQNTHKDEMLEDKEPEDTKKEKDKKDSVPNIFLNKGESKSMRKSLVLKPTSVRIAERYCSKNNGSFNELIQHLLDNFIDEYGLK